MPVVQYMVFKLRQSLHFLQLFLEVCIIKYVKNVIHTYFSVVLSQKNTSRDFMKVNIFGTDDLWYICGSVV